MSAPSLLNGGRTTPEAQSQVQAQARDRSRGQPQPDSAFSTGYSQRADPVGPSAGSLDPIDRLALSLATLCGEAVDPLAIVAGLEAEGHNDRLAQERHGLPDLFALAEELYRRVPRGAQTQARRTTGPPTTRVGTIARPLLRGSLFAVPALCGLALLPPAGRTGASVRLGIALIQILAWGYGQGLAHAAYARLNAGDLGAAQELLRRSTLWALFGEVGLFGMLALATGSAPSVVLPTATALGYCLAAVPALVLGAELQLAAVLAPIGLVTVIWAAALHDAWGSAGAGLIAGTAVLGALWLAWRLTQPGQGGPEGTRLEAVGFARVRLGVLRLRLRWLSRSKSGRARFGLRRFGLPRLRLPRFRLPRFGFLRFGRSRANPIELERPRRGRLRVGLSRLGRLCRGRPRFRLRFGRRRRDRSHSPRHAGSGWAAGTAPQALYGSCVGIWLLLVLVGPIGSTQAAQLHAAATLTLSMGAAEWHYVWYRQAMRRSLAANHELAGFARHAVAVLALALARQALTTALLATTVYTVLDRHSGGIGCYLFALALSPGLLAATIIRAVAARILLALTMTALAATVIAQPTGGAVVSAEIACGYAVLVAMAAAWLSTRPWTSL